MESKKYRWERDVLVIDRTKRRGVMSNRNCQENGNFGFKITAIGFELVLQQPQFDPVNNC